MLAFVTKNHALTAVRKPLPTSPPRLGSHPRAPRRHLQHRRRNPSRLPQFPRNARPRIRRRSGGFARRAKPRKEKLARPPRRRRNQYRLRRSRIPPALRILPPRIENPLRAPQSPRNRCSRRRVRRIPCATPRKSPRDIQTRSRMKKPSSSSRSPRLARFLPKFA